MGFTTFSDACHTMGFSAALKTLLHDILEEEYEKLEGYQLYDTAYCDINNMSIYNNLKVP